MRTHYRAAIRAPGRARRRFRKGGGEPNATAGTDHGWGSPMFVLGGAVQGGLYGTFPTLDPAGPDSTDQRGRWIPTTSLDTFGATLARWFGVAEVDLPTVFPNLPNFPSSNMGFMG